MISTRVAGPQGILAIYSEGDGPGTPVLFIHADSGRASQWFEVMARIAPMRRVIGFDFRGHGESDPAADGDYSYGGRAADIAAVVDAESLDQFIVVAHSGGVGAVLEYAGRHHERVAGLFLADPATDPTSIPEQVRESLVRDLRGPQSLNVLQAYYASIAGPSAAVRQRVLSDAAVVDPAARAGVAEALARWNPGTALAEWRGPTTIVSTNVGDTPAALYRLRTDLPYRVITDAGHWVQLERPALIADMIEAFVKDAVVS